MRHLPPAHSPLSARALAAGVRAALGDDASARVRARIARDWGARDVLLADSGTSALTLALRAAASLRPGAPVALPAYGCYDLATAAEGAGLAAVLYDVSPRTLAPAPASFARAMEARPCAVVIAHLYGVPVDVSAASMDGALVVEDAAQGAGASLRGRPAGALGSISILSFGRGKGRTGGRGGALLAHDRAGEAAVRRARLRAGGGGAGWGDVASAAALWALARPSVYGVPASLPFLRLGETIHHPPSPPGTMSRAAAGVLAAGWEASSAECAVRRRHAARLLDACRAAGLAVPRVSEGAEAGWLRLPVLLFGDDVERATTPLARRLGIMPGYPRALCDLEGFRDSIVNGIDDFAGARTLAQSLVTLPTHGLLREDDLRALEAWIGALARTEQQTPIAGAAA